MRIPAFLFVVLAVGACTQERPDVVAAVPDVRPPEVSDTAIKDAEDALASSTRRTQAEAAGAPVEDEGRKVAAAAVEEAKPATTVEEAPRPRASGSAWKPVPSPTGGAKVDGLNPDFVDPDAPVARKPEPKKPEAKVAARKPAPRKPASTPPPEAAPSPKPSST